VQTNPLFERTVSALLAGEIICEYSHDELYNYLLTQPVQQKVSDFLRQINRTLRQTSSHDAWLCSYQDLSRPGDKDAVRQQFREVANHLEALVQFLRLVVIVEAAQRPISAGEHLREGKMLERISAAPSLEAKLRSLCEKELFRTKRSDSAGQLRVVLENLTKAGYLKPIGTSGSVFLATAKWSWLYDVMTFIQAHEGIREDSAEDDPQLRIV
jgi:hypothetical protein